MAQTTDPNLIEDLPAPESTTDGSKLKRKAKSVSILDATNVAIKKQLEDYEKTLAQGATQSDSSIDSEQLPAEGFPGTETVEERFPGAFGSTPTPGASVFGRQAASPSFERYPGMPGFEIGSNYLGNKELYHTTRSRIRYSDLDRRQITPLVRGTKK